MRTFLKNNLLAILVCLGSFSALSFATTITRPYGPSDYAGGQAAVGAKVNAEFQSIVDWLNGGNIASSNIAAAGVLTANLADSSVTTAKVADGAITAAKRSAANILITSSSSLFQNTGALAQVTNLSTVITATGRPVLVRLEPANTSYLVSGSSALYGSIYSNDSSGFGSYLTILKDSGTLAKQPVPYVGANGENASPCSQYSFLDVPAAGSRTYSVGVESAVGVTASVSGCRLSVVEL